MHNYYSELALRDENANCHVLIHKARIKIYGSISQKRVNQYVRTVVSMDTLPISSSRIYKYSINTMQFVHS